MPSLRAFHSLCMAFACAVLLVSKASAGPISIGTWYEFSFEAPGAASGCTPADPAGLTCVPGTVIPTTFLDAPPWTFTVPADGAFLTVTDGFLSGDRFALFNNGSPLGLTSAPVAGLDCGNNPVVCASTPGISSVQLTLAPGPYSLTLNATQGDIGAGFLQVSNVPEPAAVGLMGFGITVLTAVGIRRRKENRS